LLCANRLTGQSVLPRLAGTTRGAAAHPACSIRYGTSNPVTLIERDRGWTPRATVCSLRCRLFKAPG
jgi:hypothetical protein